jgi:tRNA U54 and U55 pseudouridine synthase Pus10
MDVRMLGEGRPFVFEIENPKRTLLKKEDIKAIED